MAARAEATSRVARSAMRIFVDTEFIDTGTLVHPISFGAVREDGATFYAEVKGCPFHLADDWVRANVIPHLKPEFAMPVKALREQLECFCQPRPTFYGDHCSYDWLVICQLWGRMMDGPKGWPHRINDVAQFAASVGVDELEYPAHEGKQHNALDDALWTRDCYNFIASRLRN